MPLNDDDGDPHGLNRIAGVHGIDCPSFVRRSNQHRTISGQIDEQRAHAPRRVSERSLSVTNCTTFCPLFGGGPSHYVWPTEMSYARFQRPQSSSDTSRAQALSAADGGECEQEHIWLGDTERRPRLNPDFVDGTRMFPEAAELQHQLSELEEETAAIDGARLSRSIEDVTAEIVRFNLGLVRSYCKLSPPKRTGRFGRFEAAGLLPDAAIAA